MAMTKLPPRVHILQDTILQDVSHIRRRDQMAGRALPDDRVILHPKDSAALLGYGTVLSPSNAARLAAEYQAEMRMSAQELEALKARLEAGQERMLRDPDFAAYIQEIVRQVDEEFEAADDPEDFLYEESPRVVDEGDGLIRMGLAPEVDLVLMDWFRFRFNDAESIPPELRAQTITMRLIRWNELALANVACATTRADGTLIRVGCQPQIP